MERTPRLIVLGSGTSVPRAGRTTSCYLVDPGDGRALLIDLGPGALQRAAALGYDLDRLHGILVTHIHPDHSADLVALDFALRNPIPRAGMPALDVWGHADLALLHARVRNAWPGWLGSGPERLRLQTVEVSRRASTAGTPVDAPGFRHVAAFPIAHTQSSVGYRLTLPNGFVIAFSGDAAEGAGLLDLGRDSDLFVLEAAVPESRPVEGHLSPERAARVGQASGTRHLLLTHFYPGVLGEPMRPRVRSAFRGRLSLAEDGMILPLVP